MMAARRVEPDALVSLEPSPPGEPHGRASCRGGAHGPGGRRDGPFPEGMRARPESLPAQRARRGIPISMLPARTLVVSGDEFPDERGSAVARRFGSDELHVAGLDHGASSATSSRPHRHRRLAVPLREDAAGFARPRGDAAFATPSGVPVRPRAEARAEPATPAREPRAFARLVRALRRGRVASSSARPRSPSSASPRSPRRGAPRRACQRQLEPRSAHGDVDPLAEVLDLDHVDALLGKEREQLHELAGPVRDARPDHEEPPRA